MKKLKPCRDCETPISPRARVCPHCGLRKPHEPAFISGMHQTANGLMALGLLAIILVFLVMCVGAATAEPIRVAGDALEVDRVYILQDRTPQYPPRNLRRVRGDLMLPGGSPIDVIRRVIHNGRPWYWVRWIKPRTLDRSQDGQGWIDSRDLMEHGVTFHHQVWQR